MIKRCSSAPHVVHNGGRLRCQLSRPPRTNATVHDEKVVGEKLLQPGGELTCAHKCCPRRRRQQDVEDSLRLRPPRSFMEASRSSSSNSPNLPHTNTTSSWQPSWPSPSRRGTCGLASRTEYSMIDFYLLQFARIRDTERGRTLTRSAQCKQ